MTEPPSRPAVTWNRDGAVVEIVLDGPPANALGLEIIPACTPRWTTPNPSTPRS